MVCSSASSKDHGLDKLLFYFPVYVSTAACIALVFVCYSTVHSSLTSSWRPAHVSWLEFFGKFSLLEAFLVILYPDILGPNYRVQNRTPTLLGEVISDDQFLSWIWYSYKTLKLALQRRLGIELSTQASTKNNTVTKHQNPPSTQPLGLSNTHFLTLDETYALKTHRHLSSFIPASTLTSAVWQNSTKAGLLESKETAQVLWGTTLSCYALHKIKMHFQTHVLSGLLQVSLYFPSAAMFVKCFSRPLYVSLQGYGRDDFAVYYRRVFGIYQVPTFTCMSVSIANQVSSSISASSC